MGWFARIGCFLAVMLFPAAEALAHAMLAKATPAVGSTVNFPPNQVVLEFTEQVEPAFSTIHIADANGNQISQGAAQLLPGREDALVIGLTAIGSGTYKVVWKAVSVDTHVTKGSFSFTVRETP